MLLPLVGCALPCACDRGWVSAKIGERAGYDIGPPACIGEIQWPNGSSLDDGLTEEEAVLLALWNNAAFQELLTELGMAEGDLVQAGLLPNPEILYLASAPHKPFRYAIDLPIEAFWLRPIRIDAAEHESQRACERLTQAGLDLIRDTRQAYADMLLAQGRLRVAEEAVELRGRIVKLAEARLDAGDASPQEVSTARIDALAAEQDVSRLAYDITLAEERLRWLMGISDVREPLRLEAPPLPPDAELDANLLADDAVMTRPDALAAVELALAAEARLRLAEVGWFRLLAIFDATSGEKTGHEFSPGFRATLPILNWNGGNITRADAELEKAIRQQQTVHNQIMLDVHQAHARVSQARAELQVLEEQVQPAVEAAIRQAESAYREGDSPYVVVLQTTRQLLDSRLRREQLESELRRAWAELERSVGHHLQPAGETSEEFIETPTPTDSLEKEDQPLEN